jgi:hypothetical protein
MEGVAMHCMLPHAEEMAKLYKGCKQQIYIRSGHLLIFILRD